MEDKSILTVSKAPEPMSEFDRAAKALQMARRIVFFTGAGISAESGIPTFRDKLTGLWSTHDAPSLETPDAFRRNPSLVWGFYLWRRQQAKQAMPNAAHIAIQRFATADRKICVVTQNIDDLHERSGAQEIIHLHGSLEKPKCFACMRYTELAQDELIVPDKGVEKEPPRCRHCNGRLRPGVVWFGEELPAGPWKVAMRNIRGCDVLVSVGTSGIVTPAADIPEIAHEAGAIVIHINVVDVSLGGENELMLVGSATTVLGRLLDAISL